MDSDNFEKCYCIKNYALFNKGEFYFYFTDDLLKGKITYHIKEHNMYYPLTEEEFQDHFLDKDGYRNNQINNIL